MSVETELKIETAVQLGKALKDYFKNRFGITIKTRYIKTVRGLEGSWYEISTFRTGFSFTNDFRKEIMSKFLPEAKVLNEENIHYGNIGSQSISLYGRQWIELLKTA